MTIIRGQNEGKEQGASKNDAMREKFFNKRGWVVRVCSTNERDEYLYTNQE